MKTLKPTLIALTVAVVALTGMADSGHSEEKGTQRRGARAKTQIFSVSGSFSGLLSGDVIINGQSAFISDHAVIYDVNDGILEAGSVVSSSNVCLSGVVKNGDRIVTIVIVSRDEASDYSNMTMPNMIASPSQPR